CRLWRNIGSRAVYSNLGVGLLGLVLSDRAGQSYEEVIRTRICEPLGLHDTTITLTSDQQNRLAPGHSAHGERVKNWDFPTLAGAGALRSTMRDLLRYLDANLNSTANPLRSALEMCHIVYTTSGPPHPYWQSYGLAFGLSGLGLFLQWAWPIPPGSWKFLATVSLPTFLASILDGLLPALGSNAASVLG